MTRDDKGRFVKGVSGNPRGRGKKEVEESYLQAFRDAVSPLDWNAILVRAVTDAKKGDAVARKFVADYLIGPAVQKVAPTTPDGEREYGSDAIERLVSRLLPEIADTGAAEAAIRPDGG